MMHHTDVSRFLLVVVTVAIRTDPKIPLSEEGIVKL